MDTLNITIHEDGMLEIKTSDISDGNHLSADALMAELDKLMGGNVRITPNDDALKLAHVHQHKHGFAHAH